MLVLASVIGREFGIDALARLAAVSVDELLETLDEAMAARVVSDDPGAPGRLRFAHVLIRDTLYEGLTSAAASGCTGCAVEALEALYGDEPGPHLAELAHHAIAGQRLRQGRALRPAGRRPRARAARLRGGRAPVRDGARGARARGAGGRGDPLRAAARLGMRRRGRRHAGGEGDTSCAAADLARPRRAGAARAGGARIRRAMRVVPGRERSRGSCRCSRMRSRRSPEDDALRFGCSRASRGRCAIARCRSGARRSAARRSRSLAGWATARRWRTRSRGPIRPSRGPGTPRSGSLWQESCPSSPTRSATRSRHAPGTCTPGAP